MGITAYARKQIGDFFRNANRIRREAKLRDPILKAASRTPMLSQVGRLLEESGIRHLKPAEIVKKVPVKAAPVTAENIRKMSQAPPMSSHYRGLLRRRGTLNIGQDSTNPKLAEDQALGMLRWAISRGR